MKSRKDWSGMEAAYEEYSHIVYGYLFSQCHDAALSEDLMQETFYQAMKSIDSYRGEARFSSWLCGIARNKLYEWQRKHPDTRQLEDNLEQNMKNIRDTELLKQIHELEEPYREVLYLRMFGDLSFAQIGEILSRTENWARVAFFRGRNKLRQKLEEAKGEI